MNFSEYKYSDDFVKSIIVNEIYQQNNKSEKNFINDISINKKQNHLLNVIIQTNDSECMLDNSQLTIDKKKLEIATLLDEEQEKYYDIFNYSKFFKKKLIQRNIQKLNSLSSILYLCDYYKINVIIYDKLDDLYIELNDKYDKKQIYQFNNGWNILNKQIDNLILKSIYDIDITKYLDDDLNKKYNIYDNGLKTISNYKLADLQMIASTNNIDININGKNKLKNKLYQELSQITNIKI